VMRRLVLLSLVTLVVLTCRRGGTTSPPGPPPSGGGGSGMLYYTADVRFIVRGETLTVVFQFRTITRGDTVPMDAVWVGEDTLTDFGNREYVWSGPFRDSLPVGFSRGSVRGELTLGFRPIAPPIFVQPSQDTVIHSGDPFTVQVSIPARPFRFVVTDAYNIVRIVDTLLSDTAFPLPEILRSSPATYNIFVEAWDTLSMDTVNAFLVVVRGGGVSRRRIVILAAPSTFALFVDSLDPDPTDTIPVRPSWPVISWTPDTVGIHRLWVVRLVGGVEDRILWDISGWWDAQGNVIPFRPPVYYGRFRSDYVADSSLGIPPDSLTPGDTFLIRVGRNNQVLDSVFYTP